MNEFWQGRGGVVVKVALVVGLIAVVLAVLIPDHETGDLGGTAWTLAAYGSPGALISAEAPASITFEDNGRLGGFTGCNRFFGNFRAEGDQWEIVDGEQGRTLAVCAEDTPEGAQELFFWQVFTDGRYTRTADRLTLHFDNGQIAEFIPTPE